MEFRSSASRRSTTSSATCNPNAASASTLHRCWHTASVTGSSIVFARRLGLGAVFVLAAASADGALYRWVDENGRVQYSDTPPQKDRSAVQLSNRGMVLKKI